MRFLKQGGSLFVEIQTKEMKSFDDFCIGRKYRVTNEIEVLRANWDNFDLDPSVDLNYFKDKDGWCRAKDSEDQLIQIEWSGDSEWFPWTVLSNKSEIMTISM